MLHGNPHCNPLQPPPYLGDKNHLPWQTLGAVTTSSCPHVCCVWDIPLNSDLPTAQATKRYPEHGDCTPFSHHWLHLLGSLRADKMSTQGHALFCHFLILSSSSVTRTQAQCQLLLRGFYSDTATHLLTANSGCGWAMHIVAAQANLRQPKGARPYWVILSCTHWSVSPTMAHLEGEERATVQ